MGVRTKTPGCTTCECGGTPCACLALPASPRMSSVHNAGGFAYNYFGPMTRVADLGPYVTALRGVCGWVGNCFRAPLLTFPTSSATIVVCVAPTPGTIPATFTFSHHSGAAGSTCPAAPYDAHSGLVATATVDGTTTNPSGGQLNTCAPLNVGTTGYSLNYP